IVMMWIRWTLPRLRIDQVMTTCLKYCVPLAAICFVGSMGWLLADLWSPNNLAPSAGKHRRSRIHEGWVYTAAQEAKAAAKPPAEKPVEKEPANDAGEKTTAAVEEPDQVTQVERKEPN